MLTTRMRGVAGGSVLHCTLENVVCPVADFACGQRMPGYSGPGDTSLSLSSSSRVARLDSKAPAWK